MEAENGVVQKELEPSTDVQIEKKTLDSEPSNPSINLAKLAPEESCVETCDLAAAKQATPVTGEDLPAPQNEPSLPIAEAILASVEPHQAIAEPSKPVVEASPPSVEPRQPVVEPSKPVVEPTQPAPTPAAPTVAEQALLDKKKKEEDKLSIYKALAIKLKKELVKVKDEFQKFQADKESECRALNERVEALEKTLSSHSETSSSTISTLEATLKNLKQQLTSSEQDLCTLQENFENYKNKAQQIMLQSSLTQPQCNRTIDDERLRQLKELNDDQTKQLANLEKQLTASTERNRALELELRQLQEKLAGYQTRIKFLEAQQQRHDSIQLENDSLKIALKQFRTKLREPNSGDSTRISDDESRKIDRLLDNTPNDDDSNEDNGNESVQKDQDLHEDKLNELTQSNDTSSTLPDSLSQTVVTGTGTPQLSSIPPTFEITSRSSAIEDARNQIDSLTKAYLDSENTNALLSDQVITLKQEIRRLQLATERIELADNLEYLKNIVLKFLSLDGSQTAQKQRLVPVLSTVLKLSSDETMLLNSTAMASDKNSLASSFFKL